MKPCSCMLVAPVLLVFSSIYIHCPRKVALYDLGTNMDPFTFIATLAGFASVVATVVSTTYAYGSSVIEANEAVKDFLAELQALRTLLQQLETMIVKMENSDPHFPEISAKLMPTITEGQASLQALHSKL